MPHLVNRRGYWSLEESFRDEQGRPRKRVLSYYGKNKPFNFFTDVDWGKTLRGDGKAFNEPVPPPAPLQPQAQPAQTPSSALPAPALPAEALSVVGGSLEAKQVDNDGQEQEVHEASSNDDVADVGEVHVTEGL